MKRAGYIVTAKFFVPSPKDDFAKQAQAASMMATLTSAKTLSPDFLEVAEIVNVSAKYGSAE